MVFLFVWWYVYINEKIKAHLILRLIVSYFLMIALSVLIVKWEGWEMSKCAHLHIYTQIIYVIFSNLPEVT